jgi:catalase
VIPPLSTLSTTAAEDNLSDQFFEDFAAAPATHQAWERETDSIPA